MADLVIKPSSGNLVLKDDQNATRMTVATSTGATTLTNQVFPAGHIIKTSSVFYDNSATQVVISADATCTEIHSGLRLTHTAESASNILLMTFSTAFCSPNANNLYGAKFYNQSGSADITIPSASGSRRRQHWSMRVTPNDANDQSMLNMSMRHVAGSTSAITYTIMFYTQSPDVQFFSSTLSDANGFSAGGTFIIYEIQA